MTPEDERDIARLETLSANIFARKWQDEETDALARQLPRMLAALRFVSEHMDTLGVAIACWENIPHGTELHREETRAVMRQLEALRAKR